MLKVTCKFLSFKLVLFIAAFAAAQQVNDTSFNTFIKSPSYSKNKPRVLVDAAHFNVFSTITDRIDPLINLLNADGYQVETSNTKFTSLLLRRYQIIVILTAQGGPSGSGSALSALNNNEIDAVYDWINNGGSLLLGLDHEPFNYAAVQLAKKLGIDIGIGDIEDSIHSEAGTDKGPDGRRATLVYSRSNGLLGNHVITKGRNDEERINKVAVWGGQSLKPPKGSSILFRLSPTAYNLNDSSKWDVVTYNAQAIAFTLGKGRVVVTADCSMWTAQLVKLNEQWVQYGMARKDLDNRQLAINVMHWLSHLIN